MKGKLTLSIAIAALTGIAAYAKPADPRPKTFIQPDGQQITVMMRGDERQHFYLSADSKLLVLDNDAFCYGDVDEQGIMHSSGIMATDPEKRTAQAQNYLRKVDTSLALSRLEKRAMQAPARVAAPHSANAAAVGGPGLFPDASFPVKGYQKVLVIIVEYQDVTFKLDDPYAYFNSMLNEEGFSLYGGTGSAADYFRENSRGQFDPEFDLYGPVVLPKNRGYYGANDIWGNDEHPADMIIDACKALDDEIDFSQYDRDNDGYIDNVYVFYAGEGEASGGASNTIWPHSWNVTAAYTFPYMFDGVRLDRYACSNEWEGTHPDGPGTFVHEFSHVMGLPDLYATSYTGAFTPGAWSALDYGPYNNDGFTPPNYGAFERYALGWMRPKVLDGPNNCTLQNITNNEAYIINTTSPNEFFLFENRQQQGWDTYIPGHGMLVWHVDYDEYKWSSNTVNNSSSHQYVDIEEADNNPSEGSRAGDPFPGTRGITSFTDDTKPSMKTWAGKELGLPITDIEENDGVITFHVAGGLSDLNGTALTEITDVTATSATLAWTEDPNATHYLVSVYSKVEGADRETRNYVAGWNDAKVDGALSCTITGLQPLTLYYCNVKTANNVFQSDESEELSFVTAEPTFEFFAPVAAEATDIEKDQFVAHWEPMADAVAYTLNVFSKGEPTCNTDVCDFTGGVNKMPKGWSTNSRLTYANTAYSGNAVPSLRLAAADAYVSTPFYSADILSLSFWHRGSNTSSENCIRIKILQGSNYTEYTTVPIVNEVGGVTTVIDDLPEGTRAVRIEYVENVRGGSIALDDVVVEWDLHYPIKAVTGYCPVEMGDALSCLVEGLAPSTTYYYTVTASNGEVFSLPSKEIEVTTLEGSGITDASALTGVGVAAGEVVISGTPGVSVAVYDITGRLVNETSIGSSGSARVGLLPGIYILRAGASTYKLKI